MFTTYNEASDKNWECQTQFGENNSGSMGINGYQENEASKDWLITKNAINFDNSTGEKLSLYSDAKYGTTTLDLVYSSDYDGSGNPDNFTWNSVPNLATITHTSGSTEGVYTFDNVNISAISGTAVYIAIKYYSDGSPTRWTVDSFEITAETSTLSTDDFTDEIALIAYPNPSNGNFKIVIPHTQKQVVIEIYTIQSQLISRKSYTVNNGKINISLETKPVGLYFAKVQLENQTAKSIKLIKK